MQIFAFINRIARLLRVACCLGLVVVLASCNDSDQPYPRQMEKNAKIEVKVESGGKIYSGYAIRNYQFSSASGMFSDTDHFYESGEAVVIKVGDNGYLFMLVNFDPSYIVEDRSPRSAIAKLTSVNEPFEMLQRGQAPFVTFSDINNPLSVKKVKITELSNFEDFLGNDAKLLSITITPTNEPVTWGLVEKIIPWIQDGIKNKNLFASDEKNYSKGPPYNSLSTSFFIKGEPK